MILFFTEAIDLGFAMIVGDGHNTAVATLDVDGVAQSWRLFSTQGIDKNVKRIVSQVFGIAWFVDVPDVCHIGNLGLLDISIFCFDRPYKIISTDRR